jgi:hypothetical protein
VVSSCASESPCCDLCKRLSKRDKIFVRFTLIQQTLSFRDYKVIDKVNIMPFEIVQPYCSASSVSKSFVNFIACEKSHYFH